MNSYNSISISYSINKGNDEINIFGKEFVKNNINNCTMIIDNKKYKISEKFNVQNYNKDKIIVKLKGINKITNMSQMFYYCESLSSLPDISKWNTSNVNNMSYMFCNCSSLSSLPDISKWDTFHLEKYENIFKNCSKLINKPIIEIKKKGFFEKLFG